MTITSPPYVSRRAMSSCHMSPGISSSIAIRLTAAACTFFLAFSPPSPLMKLTIPPSRCINHDGMLVPGMLVPNFSISHSWRIAGTFPPGSPMRWR